MKKLFNLLIIIFAMFLFVIFNCQQAGGSGGGGGGSGGGDDEPPVQLTVRSIKAGYYYTGVLFTNGTVKCWGYNEYGQLGYGDTEYRGDEPGEMGNNLPAVDLGTGRTADKIALGGGHTVVLLDNGTVKCWGDNDRGQLGYGDTERRGDEPGEMGNNLPAVDLGTGRTAVQIAAGISHTMVLLDNGSVKCWGNNRDGQLGYGNIQDRGDEVGEMGNNLLSVDLGTGRRAVQIAAGYNYSAALLDNGTVKCWGYNAYGQLGYGDTEDRGDDPGEMGNNLLPVDMGTGRTAIQISCGYNFVAVLLDDGTVKCWGNNEYGQLGYGNTNHRGDEPGEMGNNLLPVELGIGGTGRIIAKITSGSYHTIVLFDNGTIKCWGRNFYGQLGYGDTNDRGDNPGEMGINLPTVDLGTGVRAQNIYIGDQHTVTLLGDGRVKCWGNNETGQLGYEDTNHRGNNPGEMGDNLPFVSLW